MNIRGFYPVLTRTTMPRFGETELQKAAREALEKAMSHNQNAWRRWAEEKTGVAAQATQTPSQNPQSAGEQGGSKKPKQT